MFDISDVIAHVESGKNPYAIRYEPAHKPHLPFVDRMQKLCGCSDATAQMLCMSSFGLYQIMGDTLVDLGLLVPPLLLLTNSVSQKYYFNKFLKRNNINYSLEQLKDAGTRLKFATYYNGPAHPEIYAQRMESVMHRLGIL